MEGAAGGVLGRLGEAGAERRGRAAERAAEREAGRAPGEDAAAFSSGLRARLEGVEARARGAGGTADPAGALEAAEAELRQAEEDAAAAAYYLPAFESRQAMELCQRAGGVLKEARAQHAPRKKFAFRRKPKVAASADRNEVAAGAGDGGGGRAEAAAPPAAASPSAAAAAPAPAAAAAAQEDGLRGERGGRWVVPRERLGGVGGFCLEDLEGCEVFLPGAAATLRVRGLRNCRIFAGPVRGPFFADRLQDCTVHVAARQVRIHDSAGTTFAVRVASQPIIEGTTGARFAPYGWDYPGLTGDLEGAGLGTCGGQWAEVNDFGWLRQTASPNWVALRGAAGPPAAPPLPPPGEAREPPPPESARARGLPLPNPPP